MKKRLEYLQSGKSKTLDNLLANRCGRNIISSTPYFRAFRHRVVRVAGLFDGRQFCFKRLGVDCARYPGAVSKEHGRRAGDS